MSDDHDETRRKFADADHEQPRSWVTCTVTSRSGPPATSPTPRWRYSLMNWGHDPAR